MGSNKFSQNILLMAQRFYCDLKKIEVNPLPDGAGNAQNPRKVAFLPPEVERDCEKLRRSCEEFFGSMERELSRDSIHSIFERSPFVNTSSSSLRIFQIDDLEHLVFV